MWLKCNHCGNVYSSERRSIGGICGVNHCTGTLVYFAHFPTPAPKAAKLDLRCPECGNVYTSASGRKIFDTCGVNGCKGQLERYWG